jgi:hypothetical protein
MSDEEPPEPFTIPLPPPGFPGRPMRDVIYFRADESADTGEARDHEDLMIRRVPRETAMRMRAAAGGRAMTYAQYLAALVALHARIRELADAGDDALQGELETLGLTTISV